MPKVITPTPDVNVSVMRPVVYSIVRDVLERTGLNPDAPILYPDEVDGVRQMGSAITEEAPNRFQNKTKVIVEAKETYEPSRLMSTPVLAPTGKSIFTAAEVSTAIVPAYSRTELELSLQIHTRDKVTAVRWQDDIRMRMSAGRREQTHMIDYNFMIPQQYIETLRMIHGLREKQAGYGENFDEWLGKCLTPKATIATDLAGQNGAWVVGERQIEVLGWFDFDTPEAMTREDGPTHWTASVTYKVQYDKPIELFMCYPLVVHNQVVPAAYRGKQGLIDTYQRPKTSDDLTGWLYRFRSDVTRFALPGSGVRIPYWSEFYPDHAIPFTATVLTAMTVISEGDKRLLLDLNDLGERSIESNMLKFILESEAAFIRHEKMSVFNLALYSGDDLVSPDRFTLSSNGLIVANEDLSLRENYHLRLTLYMDWRLLNAAAIERLRMNTKIAIELLQFLGFAKSSVNDGVVSNRAGIMDLSAISVNMPIASNKMRVIVDNTGLGNGVLFSGVSKKASFTTVGTLMIQARPANAPADPTDYHPTEKNPL